MKKRISVLLAAVLAIGCLAVGCDNTPAGGEVKVGLGLHTQMNYKSSEATADKAGLAQADLTVVAVTLNADGTIASIKVDAIQVKTNFDAKGELSANNVTSFTTKREQGDEYGMKGQSAGKGKIEGGAEWFEQADAFEAWAKGKTIAQIEAAMGADQYPAEGSDLLAGCTMKINGFVIAAKKAVEEAQKGTYKASATDKLSIGMVAEATDHKAATATENGGVTAYANFTAVTSDASGKITCCVLDSVQAKFKWDATGKFTSNITEDTDTCRIWKRTWSRWKLTDFKIHRCGRQILSKQCRNTQPNPKPDIFNSRFNNISNIHETPSCNDGREQCP